MALGLLPCLADSYLSVWSCSMHVGVGSPDRSPVLSVPPSCPPPPSLSSQVFTEHLLCIGCLSKIDLGPALVAFVWWFGKTDNQQIDR